MLPKKSCDSLEVAKPSNCTSKGKQTCFDRVLDSSSLGQLGSLLHQRASEDVNLQNDVGSTMFLPRNNSFDASHLSTYHAGILSSRLNLAMDFSDLIEMAFLRIKELDPVNATKILGYLLLQDHIKDENDIVWLAFGPDSVLQASIDDAKRELHLLPSNLCTNFTPFAQTFQADKDQIAYFGSPNMNYYSTWHPTINQMSSLNSVEVSMQFCQQFSQGHCKYGGNCKFLHVVHGGNGQLMVVNRPSANATKILGYLLLQDHIKDENDIVWLAFGPDSVLQASIDDAKRELHLLPSNLCTNFTPFAQTFQADKDQIAYFGSPNMNYYSTWHPTINQMSSLNSVEVSMQFCQQFSQGHCKYGGNCKFLHVVHGGNGQLMVVNRPSANAVVNNLDHEMSYKSVKNLEKEIIKILKTRRGVPIPVAALPVLYGEKYGRILQIEGYVIPGDDVGCTLTQMLAATTCIRLMDRPHGHHCLILQKDIPTYLRFLEERSEAAVDLTSSCQVFLILPPNSMVMEQQAHNYFNNFGPVLDVFFPNQEKRTFGFVTFVYPETVSLVLIIQGNPHLIHGIPVEVKSHRNKPIINHRKSKESVHASISSSSSCLQDTKSKPVASKTFPELHNGASSQKNQLNEESADRKGKSKMDMESSSELTPR